MASAAHTVVDRRRMELVGDGLPAAPIHREGGAYSLHRSAPPLADGALAALVKSVRASAVGTTAASLDALVAALPEPITSMSIRTWPADFPTDVSTQRRVPHESRSTPTRG